VVGKFVRSNLVLHWCLPGGDWRCAHDSLLANLIRVRKDDGLLALGPDFWQLELRLA